jgi:RNA recognition motif-containing protein
LAISITPLPLKVSRNCFPITEKSRGFGFVEMTNQSEAEKAKKALNGSDFKGRALKINEAQPTKGGFKGKGRSR